MGDPDVMVPPRYPGPVDVDALLEGFDKEAVVVNTMVRRCTAHAAVAITPSVLTPFFCRRRTGQRARAGNENGPVCPPHRGGGRP